MDKMSTANDRFTGADCERKEMSMGGSRFSEYVAGIPQDVVQGFIDSVTSTFCPECGKPVKQPRRGRMKIFCCEKCRLRWKYRHPRPEKWKSSRQTVCPMCGREFTASREYGRLRKYCSHACANRGRALEKRGEPLPMAGKTAGAEDMPQDTETKENTDDEGCGNDGGGSNPL